MIERKFCEVCGDFDLAERVQNRLLKESWFSIDQIELVPCGTCSFDVRVDGEDVYSQEGHVSDLNEVVSRVSSEMEA